MSHQPPSPANSPDQADGSVGFLGWSDELVSRPQGLGGSPDQVGGPKLQGWPEELVSKASSHANSPDLSRSGPGRRAWPEEDFTSTTDEGGGFYSLRLGEVLNDDPDDNRFVIMRKLGWGEFSSVWLARDRKEDRHVALKVLSSYASREIEAGRLGERDILRKITNSALLHPGFQHVVHLLDEFVFESSGGRHICFVTNVLCYNVTGLQRELGGRLLPLKFILRLVKHVLKGLEYLHDKCGVVHSDLKPANILLMTPKLDEVVMCELVEYPAHLFRFPAVLQPKDIPVPPVRSAPLPYRPDDKLPLFHWATADLGHAHLQREHLNKVVQPYALRAPEVILGLGWGPAIDIWSLGCLMYEFATGHWLFSPEAKDDISRDVVHLAQMTQRTGQDHDDAALKQYESRGGRNDLRGGRSDLGGGRNHLRGLLRRATAEGTKLGPIESELNESTTNNRGSEEVANFNRIMLSFLTFDPTKRPRAAEALLDPAFDLV